MLKMQIAGVALNAATGAPFVLLNDGDDSRVMPIFIGMSEATAISLALKNVQTDRPRTHQLLEQVITKLGWKLVRVEITKIEDNTFFAELVLVPEFDKLNEIKPPELRMDSRPSDAIALATVAGAPIFVDPDVFAQSSVVLEEEKPAPDAEEFSRFVDTVKPSDFAKLLSGEEKAEPEDTDQPGEES